MKGIGKIETSSTIERVLIQTIAGGTISKLTGGKFGNGAITSAIQFVVNEISFSNVSKVKDVLDSLQDELYDDFQKIKELMVEAKSSDEIINYLEDREYIEFGEWDRHRGLDLTNAKSSQVLDFELRVTDSMVNIRSTWARTTLQKVGNKIGKIMVDQYSFSGQVKNAVFDMNPNKVEGFLYKLADDVASATGG